MLVRLGQDPDFQPPPLPMGWDQALASQLPDPDSFQAGGLRRAAKTWDRFFIMAQTPEQDIQEVRPWLTEGVAWPMLPVFHANQPQGTKRLKKVEIVRGMLRRALPKGADIEAYLTSPTPQQVSFPNNPSILEFQDFVAGEVQSMLQKGVIQPWTAPHPPVVVNGLLVCTDKWPKLRLCLSPMYPNLWWEYRPLVYDKLHELVPLSQPGDWAMTTDDKHGYWHVPLHTSMWPYLAFTVGGVTYNFTHLPFGVAPACYVYTKIKETIFSPLRSKGLRILFLIDDQLNLQQGYARAQAQSSAMASLLSLLGFVISIPKCTLQPTRELKFLGLGVDLHHRRFFVPEDKRASILAVIKEHLAAETLTNRQMASLAGKLMALQLALHLAPLLARSVHKLADGRGWDTKFPTTSQWQAELQLTQDLLETTHARNWFSRHTSLILVGDASESALAAFTPNRELSAPIIQPFTTQQQQQFVHGQWSSTARELEALHVALQVSIEQCPDKTRGGKVQYCTDSQAGAHAMSNMRAGHTLFPLVKHILLYCAREDVQLSVTWRPRDHPEQQQADDWSKQVDEDDWVLNQEAYKELISHPVLQGQQVTIDVFASAANTKVRHAYYAKFWGPGCLGIDAFDHPWTYPTAQQHLAFVNSPWRHRTRVLRHIATQRVNCILLLPDAPFPGEVFLTNMPIRTSLLLPTCPDLWQPGALLPKHPTTSRATPPPVRAHFILW